MRLVAKWGFGIGFEEVVAIRRDGDQVEVTNDQMGGELSCSGGSPTITNTDFIALVEDPTAVQPSVYFDLSKGYMAPGDEVESSGLSEIEIGVQWTGALDISMTDRGRRGKGSDCRRVKADILYGEGGDDRVSGGEGRDEIFVKGGGTDRVNCGADRDKVMADKSDKVAGDCERVST